MNNGYHADHGRQHENPNETVSITYNPLIGNGAMCFLDHCRQRVEGLGLVIDKMGILIILNDCAAV